MLYHIENKIYHVEVLPPKQNSKKLDEDLETFIDKYNKVIESGYCACITDNAMGFLSFQGTELIEEFELEVVPEQVMIHLNTFHSKEDLDKILDTCQKMGIKYLLIISGDGSDRLPKLQPSDVGVSGVESVTSVELLRYIRREYPDFIQGVAFNPYEPEDHECEKMSRKVDAGAEFVITQPLIEKNPVVDNLIEKYPDMPVIVEAWMSKKLHLLSDAVGYEIPEDEDFDPVATLKMLCKTYPESGIYLSLLNFKTQYELLKDIWV